jgi:uncharacterized protein YciI
VRKLFSLRYELDKDAYEQRMPFRPAHLELVERWREQGKIVIAGPVGDPPTYSVIAFDVEDEAEVEEFVAADPYVAERIVTSYKIEPWNVVV